MLSKNAYTDTMVMAKNVTSANEPRKTKRLTPKLLDKEELTEKKLALCDNLTISLNSF